MRRRTGPSHEEHRLEARGSRTRRRILRVVAAAVGIGSAGCTGGGSGTTTTATTTAPPTTTPAPTTTDEEDDERPPGVSEEEFVHGPVPEPYRTARSQGGERRDPDSLQTKEAVRFQEAEDAVAAGLAAAGSRCGNCAEYIPDKNGDGFGACAKVEGYIDVEDWCVLWEAIDEGTDTDAE